MEPQNRFNPAPQPDNLPGVTLSFNPRTGHNDGLWGAAPVSKPGEAETQTWDYFEYIVYHLEAVLRANLDLFLGGALAAQENVDRAGAAVAEPGGGEGENETRPLTPLL